MDDYSYREFRNGAVFLMAMADFWKEELAQGRTDILDSPLYRKLHFERLARGAAQDRVWNMGHNFFRGGLHGFRID